MQGMSPENTLYHHYKKKLVNVIYRIMAFYCENLVKQNTILCSWDALFIYDATGGTHSNCYALGLQDHLTNSVEWKSS